MGAALSQPELLDHPGKSHRPLRDDRSDRLLLQLLDHPDKSHRPLRDDRSDRTQTVLLLLLLLDHPGRSHRPLRDDRSDRTQIVLLLLLLLLQLLDHPSRSHRPLRAATLRVRHFPPKPLEELHRCSPSVCDHFVRDSARVPLPLTVTIQHRLLPRAKGIHIHTLGFSHAQ
jgi:hypothetical protein